MSDKNFLVDSNNLLEEIEKGNNMITEFGKKYGNDNPLLIKTKKYINQKIEFYYISKLDYSIEKFIEILEENGYRKSEKRDFKEIYFIPNEATSKWKNFQMVHKVFSNSYINEYIEIIQEIKEVEVEGEKGFEVLFLNRLFNDKPRQTKNLDEYVKFLGKLDFKPYLELNWETITLSKGDISISLGYNKEKNKITFMTQNKNLKDLEVKRLLKLENLSIAPQRYLLASGK